MRATGVCDTFSFFGGIRCAPITNDVIFAPYENLCIFHRQHNVARILPISWLASKNG